MIPISEYVSIDIIPAEPDNEIRHRNILDIHGIPSFSCDGERLRDLLKHEASFWADEVILSLEYVIEGCRSEIQDAYDSIVELQEEIEDLKAKLKANHD